MKRGFQNFWRNKQYKIAAFCIVAAVLGVAAVYLLAGSVGSGESGQEIASQQDGLDGQQTAGLQEDGQAQNSQQVGLQSDGQAQDGQQVGLQSDGQQEDVALGAADSGDESGQTAGVSAVIRPNRAYEEDAAGDMAKSAASGTGTAQDQKAEADTDAAQTQKAEADTDAAQATSAKAGQAAELHFDAEAGLVWPLEGTVIMDYSMDQTIYFKTLDQYKYNPAVIISGNVNDKVKAAANGKITDISTNEETGCTVTMDLGDGYSAIYGQLKEVPYNAGAYLEAGDTIGFVSEPTKYYSLEGSSLYFELQKDGVAVDPAEFFQ